jgi:hypothetical protein
LALRGLSLCHRAAGDYARAVELSRSAEGILRAAGDPLGAAYAQQSLAKALVRQGVDVTDLLAECHQVFLSQRDRFGVALAVRTMGEAALAGGDDATARALLTDALARWGELGLPLWQARTLRDLATVSSTAVSAPEAAKALWDKAIALAAPREAAEMAASDPATYRRLIDHL